MQSVSVSAAARRAPRPRAALQVALALATATAITTGMASLASAACPWIVQPEAQKVAAGTGAAPSFDIVFEGLDQSSKVFYGFTVASLDLAWQLTKREALSRLATDARRLEPRLTPYGTTAYEIAPDTIRPHTIYLVAADRVVQQLEQLQTRIEPARPLAVSELMPQLQERTRGGTDWSGPLPRRSLPGFEIAGAERAPAADAADGIGPASAEIQICAYQVAMR